MKSTLWKVAKSLSINRPFILMRDPHISSVRAHSEARTEDGRTNEPDILIELTSKDEGNKNAHIVLSRKDARRLMKYIGYALGPERVKKAELKGEVVEVELLECEKL